MFSLSLEDRQLRAVLDKVEQTLGHDPTPIFREFAQYMRVVTDNTFRALRSGGTYRSVTWKPFAPQYTRKSGVVVPAWGGVAKVHGSGVVLGRKRPSGARVDATSAIMQDLGALRARAANVLTIGKNRMTLGPQGLSYAIHQQRLRPYLFFTEKDSKEVGNIAIRHLQKALKAIPGVQ